ncbi:hypothetical protein GCM10022222_86110 [Amycolatopsis ultiminotia]|uniref:Type II secretion system protein GspF domain-containing protein n=1 Tax=Amycolatopsis ultiminotia TaxID=543629 RepID=A0ABP6YQR3_9PSEU
MTGVWPGVFGAAMVAAIACAGAAFLPSATDESRSGLTIRWNRWWRYLGRCVSLRRALTALAAATLVWSATGWPVAALLTAAAVFAVPALVRGQDARQFIERLDALASWVRRLADLLASGAGGLEQAISTSARTAPAALTTEIETLATRVRTRGLESALRAFAEEVGDEAADDVVLTLILRARAGGRGLVDVLDATATALERSVVARRDIEADRAKPRTDVRAILGITAVLFGGLVIFAHEFLTPFDDVLGQLVLAGIGALLTAAGWWMHLLTRPRRSVRLLGPASRSPAAKSTRLPTATGVQLRSEEAR